ncbi:EutP/PduV family microcompartment system protein [Escherichia coli]|uniref:EutP/PduV family microcompartment system protein n=1 Tax=Escherichia coli TaxID=562 RepID=UPI002226C424|nr:EutP/PduV family microcompartment system protein [Escherichia coli]MCW3407346.1 EutP/PduV family microcompartment system protein [Escherichia coli]HAW0208747.1 EutP/PduV family microcompartment system protein [Escherichia coli]
MQRMMLIGPSQCGKTSLTQCLRGENIHYQKTQAIVWSPTTIDTPGEYLENRSLYSALLVSACEADIIALVLNADAPWSPFSPGFTSSMNRPIIGVVTKADLASMEQISLVKCWLREAGAHNVLITMELQNFLPCCIQKMSVANFDRLSDGNDDCDTQKRINEQ